MFPDFSQRPVLEGEKGKGESHSKVLVAGGGSLGCFLPVAFWTISFTYFCFSLTLLYWCLDLSLWQWEGTFWNWHRFLKKYQGSFSLNSSRFRYFPKEFGSCIQLDAGAWDPKQRSEGLAPLSFCLPSLRHRCLPSPLWHLRASEEVGGESKRWRGKKRNEGERPWGEGKVFCCRALIGRQLS